MSCTKIWVDWPGDGEDVWEEYHDKQRTTYSLNRTVTTTTEGGYVGPFQWQGPAKKTEHHRWDAVTDVDYETDHYGPYNPYWWQSRKGDLGQHAFLNRPDSGAPSGAAWLTDDVTVREHEGQHPDNPIVVVAEGPGVLEETVTELTGAAPPVNQGGSSGAGEAPGTITPVKLPDPTPPAPEEDSNSFGLDFSGRRGGGSGDASRDIERMMDSLEPGQHMRGFVRPQRADRETIKRAEEMTQTALELTPGVGTAIAAAELATQEKFVSGREATASDNRWNLISLLFSALGAAGQSGRVFGEAAEQGARRGDELLEPAARIGDDVPTPHARPKKVDADAPSGFSNPKLGQELHGKFEKALLEQTGTREGDWLIRTKPGQNGVDATYIGPRSRNPGFKHAELKPRSHNGLNAFNGQVDRWQQNGHISPGEDTTLWFYNEQGIIGQGHLIR